jgi:hypothetical protein
MMEFPLCEYGDIVNETPNVRFLSPENEVAKTWHNLKLKHEMFNFQEGPISLQNRSLDSSGLNLAYKQKDFEPNQELSRKIDEGKTSVLGSNQNLNYIIEHSEYFGKGESLKELILVDNPSRFMISGSGAFIREVRTAIVQINPEKFKSLVHYV